MNVSVTFCHGDSEYQIDIAPTSEAGARCGIGFNTTRNLAAERVKWACAAAMQVIVEGRYACEQEYKSIPASDRDKQRLFAYNDAMRCFATALTHIETAQMYATKAQHTRANRGIKDST